MCSALRFARALALGFGGYNRNIDKVANLLTEDTGFDFFDFAFI